LPKNSQFKHQDTTLSLATRHLHVERKWLDVDHRGHGHTAHHLSLNFLQRFAPRFGHKNNHKEQTHDADGAE